MTKLRNDPRDENNEHEPRDRKDHKRVRDQRRKVKQTATHSYVEG